MTNMQRLHSIGLYSAIAAIAVGVLAVYGLPSMVSNPANTYNTNPQELGMLGHVTLIVTDPQGNIKDYRQGDNTVITTSKSCTAKILFGGTSTLCASPGTATWTTIGIGSGGSPPTQPADTVTRLVTEYTSFGLNRAAATGTSETLTDASTGVGAKAVIQGTFTNTDTGSHSVNEAGLFNGTSTTTSGMFAAQTFTAISLNQNDALTVKWTITVG